MHVCMHALTHFIMQTSMLSFISSWIMHLIMNSRRHYPFINSATIHLFLIYFFVYFFGGWGGVVSLFVLDFGDFSFISKHYRNLNTNFLKLKTMIFIDNSTVSQFSSTPAHTVEFFFKNMNHALT